MDVFDEVEEMIKKRTKPFFLWKLEFDKVFDEGGFDIVIANPPYIQLQNNGGKLANELESQGFKTFSRMGDIYCLFYEQAINLLKKNGTFAFITSNKWMRAGYGEKLRGFLAEYTNPRLLLDFGGTKIFESATVDVNILIASNSKNNHYTKTVNFADNGTENLSVYIEQNFSYAFFSNSDNWVILNKIEQSIKDKINKKGVALKNWDLNIYRGVLTGYNEAFIIDGSIAETFINSNYKNADIIRPIIRGRDIDRYQYIQPNLFMICTFPSKKYNINDYPEVRDYLLSFGIEKLEQSGKTYFIDGKTVKARKKTNNKWFETQDSINYSEEFFKQKIVYPCIMTSGPAFALDNNKNFLPAPGNIITGNNLKYLLGLLCSKIYYFALRKYYMGGGIEGELKTNRLLLLPVPPYENNEHAKNIESLVNCINANNIEQISAEIEYEIKLMLNLNDEEYNFIINKKYLIFH